MITASQYYFGCEKFLPPGILLHMFYISIYLDTHIFIIVLQVQYGSVQ